MAPRFRAVLVTATFVTAAFVTACGRGGTQLLDPRPGENNGQDAGQVDTGNNVGDTGVKDVGIVDTLPPLPNTTVGDALACHLNPEEQLEAAVRFVACSDDAEFATVSGYLEAFDAGLMGTYALGVETFTTFPVRQGCGFWRCVAQADSCAEFSRCRPTERPFCDSILAGAQQCFSSQLSVCNGREYEPIVDCAEWGATCDDLRGCVVNGCEFPGIVREPYCTNRNLTLAVCEERFNMECDSYREGSMCNLFYVGGEVPVSWCSPTGEGVAGAYSNPVFCNMGGIFFEPVTRDPVNYGCIANGYSDCDQRGCVE